MLSECADCSSPLLKIVVRDSWSYRMSYAATVGPDEKTDWLGRSSRRGKIQALMCDSCHRVFFYAEPKS